MEIEILILTAKYEQPDFYEVWTKDAERGQKEVFDRNLNQ